MRYFNRVWIRINDSKSKFQEWPDKVVVVELCCSNASQVMLFSLFTGIAVTGMVYAQSLIFDKTV